MSRLIVVSNRVPSSGAACSGGLAVALKAALSESGGLWCGWSGRVVEAPRPTPEVTQADGFSLATIDLSRAEFRGYYEQFANRALWPLCHGRLDLSRFDHDSYAVYRQVNRRFAATLGPVLGDGDVTWVHDYHFLPLGAELRRLGVGSPIGFFLHIPFPPPETFAALPWHRELLEGLCAYDVVGFQTLGCLRNFRDAIERHLGGLAGEGAVSAAGRTVRTGVFPIGIDTRAFAELAASPAMRRRAEGLKAAMREQTWIVGVERLDYTKGLAERCLAFEGLLERAPDLHGRVALVQIAAPSRESVAEYQELQARLEALSGRINARFGTLDWTPIRFINRSFDHAELAALYRVCRVGLVTPLRDGMNMVAKEYVAAQDPGDPGALVLSRFAGAADELTDALLVNPHDIQACARTLEAALKMPCEERRRRWQGMMHTLESNDVHCWRRQFLEALSPVRRPARIPAAAA